MLVNQELDALLIGALYGELTPAEEKRLEAHLVSHPADRAVLADLTRAREVVRESAFLRTQFEPSAAVVQHLMQEAARRAPAPAARESEGWFARFVRSFSAHPAMAAAAMLVLVAGTATLISYDGDRMKGVETTESIATVEPTKTPAPPPAEASGGSLAADPSTTVDRGLAVEGQGQGQLAPTDVKPDRLEGKLADQLERRSDHDGRLDKYDGKTPDDADSFRVQLEEAQGEGLVNLVESADRRAGAATAAGENAKPAPKTKAGKDANANDEAGSLEFSAPLRSGIDSRPAAPRSAGREASRAPAGPREFETSTEPPPSPAVVADPTPRPKKQAVSGLELRKESPQPKDLDAPRTARTVPPPPPPPPSAAPAPAAPVTTPAAPAPTASARDFAGPPPAGPAGAGDRSVEGLKKENPVAVGAQRSLPARPAEDKPTTTASRATSGSALSTTAPASERGRSATATSKPADPSAAWAREQHQQVIAQVRAGNCRSAAGIAVNLSNRAPGYYAQNVASDRAIKSCVAYINTERQKDAELRASRAKATRSSAGATEPAQAAPQAPAAQSDRK